MNGKDIFRIKLILYSSWHEYLAGEGSIVTLHLPNLKSLRVN